MLAATELADAGRIGAGHDVLDVAAGDGNVAIAAARRGARVVASNLTPKMVELALTSHGELIATHGHSNGSRQYSFPTPTRTPGELVVDEVESHRGVPLLLVVPSSGFPVGGAAEVVAGNASSACVGHLPFQKLSGQRPAAIVRDRSCDILTRLLRGELGIPRDADAPGCRTGPSSKEQLCTSNRSLSGAVWRLPWHHSRCSPLRRALSALRPLGVQPRAHG
jgi:hypothetical protein